MIDAVESDIYDYLSFLINAEGKLEFRYKETIYQFEKYL